MFDRILIAQAWKATEWLVRRFVSRDDAQAILLHLHALLEKPEVLAAAKGLVVALRDRNPLEIIAAGERLREVLKA